MNYEVLQEDAERFREIIVKLLGLEFDQTKIAFLAEVLKRRIEESKEAVKLYLAKLEGAPEADELRVLAKELTIGETYFYRHYDQFRAFSEIALPSRMLTRESLHKLRILSAGCASGEEAHTLAIIVNELVPSPAWEISITAIDLNPVVLAKAKQGRYTKWALRETPKEIQGRYFSEIGKEFQLSDSIRSRVKFEEENLVRPSAWLWQPDSFDIIFCRNVLMYFSRKQMHDVVGRLTKSLAPGGFLFLGHAETLRGISHEFHLCHTHDTFYYQRKDHLNLNPAPFQIQSQERVAISSSSLVEVSANSDSWVETIRLAAERISNLTEQNKETEKPEIKRKNIDLGKSLELFKSERFADALELVQTLSEDDRRDPDALLLEAVLLTHNGRLAEAECVCLTLLNLEELNAGAHYVLALCKEAVGDLEGAIDHDQRAIYLDPEFAMPRLHLGLLARRTAKYEIACRELKNALELLKREDASRLLLFGGGFSRDMLSSLCCAELKNSEGAV